MKIEIVEAHCTQEFFDFEVSAARITMTHELRSRIESMIALCQHGDVDGCYIWHYGDIEWGSTDDNDEFVEEEIRIDGSQLVVFKDGDFVFKAWEKHSEVPFETCLLCLKSFMEQQ